MAWVFTESIMAQELHSDRIYVLGASYWIDKHWWSDWCAFYWLKKPTDKFCPILLWDLGHKGLRLVLTIAWLGTSLRGWMDRQKSKGRWANQYRGHQSAFLKEVLYFCRELRAQLASTQVSVSRLSREFYLLQRVCLPLWERINLFGFQRYNSKDCRLPRDCKKARERNCCLLWPEWSLIQSLVFNHSG